MGDEEDIPDTSITVPISVDHLYEDNRPLTPVLAPTSFDRENTHDTNCLCSICWRGIKVSLGAVIGSSISYCTFYAHQQDLMNDGILIGVGLGTLVIVMTRAWKYPDILLGISSSLFVTGLLCYYLMSPVSSIDHASFKKTY